LHVVFHITVRNHIATEIVRVRGEVAAAAEAGVTN
jgi:hypothetical protein